MGREFSIKRGGATILFGAGASQRLSEAIDAIDAKKVVVVCAPGRKALATRLAEQLGARSAGVLAIAKEHVPEAIAAEASREIAKLEADVALAVGGGSAIGLAKAVALSTPIRVAAVPTTYAGSEMTPVYGITRGGEKKTGRDERVRPALVVYDPSLTLSLPLDVTIPSLWNAMAHAVEALWSKSLDRATEATAEEALRLLASSAVRLVASREDASARDDALEGAYLAGVAFADAGGGVHHKLCHVLGGSFGLPHARTHAVLLPHVTRLRREAAPRAMLAIARALGVVDPVRGLERLAIATGAPASLEALGLPRDALARVAETVARASHVDQASLTAALSAAFTGASPSSPPPLRAPEALATLSGFGSTHASEALEGALPLRQNAPRRAPYGLYPELLNGTPFTVKNAENSRVWMYRVRPSFAHGPMNALPASRFAAPLGDVEPNRTRWRPMPIPTGASVDFLDGLVTLGGAGDPVSGPGWAVHLYAANADMRDRALSSSDGDLLIVPQEGTLEIRTELGWLRVPQGTIAIIPRGIKLAVGLPEGKGRGWVLEVYGRRFVLPERGLIGSNGLADARHFLAPSASFEDRACPSGFSVITKTGGRLFEATQPFSPFDVVAWHGNHAPFTYDLSFFSAMGAVRFDHPDPSILTVLSAPLDDRGRAIADFVVFPGRWEVTEHSFRPPFMHRNAAAEVNMVIKTPAPEHGYDPGCTFISPLLTPHGVSTATYDAVFSIPDDVPDPPRRVPDESLWAMFESSMPFRFTAWAHDTPIKDDAFAALFEGTKPYFDPKRR
ncbi:MAG: homogentisate 1,2-dioxygenase [Labilithrix sp.]|nr:homogentisate 1,2-dioxygenase [Labilithrix sp.]